MAKLTYYQICSLAAQGRFNEIPSGYNIVWLGPEPHKALDTKVDGDKLTIIGDKFAKPDMVKVSGEYSVKVPSPYSIPENNKPVEYGNVYINTVFTLTELKFLYEKEENIIMLKPYLATYFDLITGRQTLTKPDVAFDIELIIPWAKLEVKNLMIKSYTGDTVNVVDFDFDYQLINFI